MRRLLQAFDSLRLLDWALPRLGLRWRGFKNLRRQVCRRIVARAAAHTS